jgi:hypothetical protein
MSGPHVIPDVEHRAIVAAEARAGSPNANAQAWRSINARVWHIQRRGFGIRDVDSLTSVI